MLALGPRRQMANQNIRFDESALLQFVQSAHLQRNLPRISTPGSSHLFGYQPWVGFAPLNLKTRGRWTRRYATCRIEINQTWNKNETGMPGDDVFWQTGQMIAICKINKQYGDFDFNSVETLNNGLVWEYHAALPCGFDDITQTEWFWGPISVNSTGEDPYHFRDINNNHGSGLTFYTATWAPGTPIIDIDDPSYVEVELMDRTCSACTETNLHITRTLRHDVSALGYGIVTQEWDITLADEFEYTEAEDFGRNLISEIPLRPVRIGVNIDFGGNDVQTRQFGPGGSANAIQLINRRNNPRIATDANSILAPPVETPCLSRIIVPDDPDTPTAFILEDDCFPPESVAMRQYPAHAFWPATSYGTEDSYVAADHTGIEGSTVAAPLPQFPQVSNPSISMGSQGLIGDAFRLKKSLFVPDYNCFGSPWTSVMDGAKFTPLDRDNNTSPDYCIVCNHGDLGPWSGSVKLYPGGGDTVAGTSHSVVLPENYGRIRRSIPFDPVNCVS